MDSMILSEMVDSVQLVVKDPEQRKQLFLYFFTDLEDVMSEEEFAEVLGESTEYDHAYEEFFESDDDDEDFDDEDEDELEDEFDDVVA